MKTVFPNRQVAHVWAQQNQSEGRSGNGNFHFRDTMIFSYNTPIAKFHTGKDGAPVVLVTAKTYSVTTSGKHMPSVWRAIGQYRNFQVPFIGVTGGYNRIDSEDVKEMHKGNFDYLLSEYRKTYEKLKRQTQKYRDENPAGDLANKLDVLKIYIEVFGLKLKIPSIGEHDKYPVFNPSIDGTQIKAIWEERDGRTNDPKEIAKREKEKARRIELKEKREAFERDYRLGTYENDLLKWRAGERLYLGYNHYTSGYGGAALRVSGDKIETSQGAEFPLEHAIKAFQFIRQRRELAQEWTTNGHSVHLGSFKIDKIEANGNVRAGCHYVEWHEIEAIARQLNIYP